MTGFSFPQTRVTARRVTTRFALQTRSRGSAYRARHATNGTAALTLNRLLYVARHAVRR
jgi:hypothetical protein